MTCTSLPTCSVYDQQHEVIQAEEEMAEEEGGEPRLALQLAKSQSRRFEQARLRSANRYRCTTRALTADENGLLRPAAGRFQGRLRDGEPDQRGHPRDPGALITYALLDNGGRAVTIDEGRGVAPLVRYVACGGCHHEMVDLGQARRSCRTPWREVLGEQVVSSFSGGHRRRTGSSWTSGPRPPLPEHDHPLLRQGGRGAGHSPRQPAGETRRTSGRQSGGTPTAQGAVYVYEYFSSHPGVRGHMACGRPGARTGRRKPLPPRAC